MNSSKTKKELPNKTKQFKIVENFQSFDERLLFLTKIININTLTKNSKLIYKKSPIEVYENTKINFIYIKKQKRLINDSNELKVLNRLNELFINKKLKHIPYTFKISKHKKDIVLFQEFFSFDLYDILTEYPINNAEFFNNILFQPFFCSCSIKTDFPNSFFKKKFLFFFCSTSNLLSQTILLN